MAFKRSPVRSRLAPLPNILNLQEKSALQGFAFEHRMAGIRVGVSIGPGAANIPKGAIAVTQVVNAGATVSDKKPRRRQVKLGAETEKAATPVSS
jgi:hypothetical protein